MTSVDHNVISNATGILTISSKSKKKSLPATVQTQTFELELELSYEDVMLAEIDAMDPYEQHMCAYLALCIEEKFLQNTKQYKYKCTKCADILSAADDKITDELLAMKGEESKQPSASTLKLIIFANAVMKMYSAEQTQGNCLNSECKTICENLDIDDLYCNFDFGHDEQEQSITHDHKKEFISQLIKVYLVMKSKKIGKKISEEERGEIIRYRKKRDYLLAGQ